MAFQDQQPLLAPKRGLYNMTKKTGNEAHRILLDKQSVAQRHLVRYVK